MVVVAKVRSTALAWLAVKRCSSSGRGMGEALVEKNMQSRSCEGGERRVNRSAPARSIKVHAMGPPPGIRAATNGGALPESRSMRNVTCRLDACWSWCFEAGPQP